MDDTFNVTYLTVGGYVQMKKYRYIYFVIMLMLYILIILSNCVIVYLIWTHQNLHEPMYIFIAALSLNSLLFSTNIYPKLLIDSLSYRQIISYQACLVQYFLFYSFCGADFLLLAAMAYDRYVAICKPLLYASIMRKRTVTFLLLFAWLMPASQVAVPAVLSAMKKLCHFTLKGIFCNNSVLKLQCVRSRLITVYGLIVLLNIAILPVLFILFTYSKILLISYRSGRDVRKKAAETCLPHLCILISFSVLCAYDVVVARLEFNFPKTVRLIMALQVILYNPVLNPIIYGVKMKEIHKHLKKLLNLENNE
ncbi:olfactory receptor 51E1-like [Salarias fasciatus]|uniref:Olfactory receptor n=1 Tax=Salarias fasciatus TaxID=181472 RepID=A0A672GZ59_SALFA|nr:olfactory receptor 51E1-like [Salarias fasciatus]